jgi:hypothetical protein
MSSLPKRESMCVKLVELFANRVDERRNMINDYLWGRTCIESVRDTKLIELFANRVEERRNMINDYLRGRAYIESVRGS